MKNEVVTVLVQMPGALKRRIVRRVHAENSNANDVIVGVLAKRYRVPFMPTGRRGNPGASGGPVVLRMPRLLKRRLQIDALRHDPSNLSERVIAALAAEFGVEVKRRTRNRSPFGGGPAGRQRDRPRSSRTGPSRTRAVSGSVRGPRTTGSGPTGRSSRRTSSAS